MVGTHQKACLTSSCQIICPTRREQRVLLRVGSAVMLCCAYEVRVPLYFDCAALRTAHKQPSCGALLRLLQYAHHIHLRLSIGHNTAHRQPLSRCSPHLQYFSDQHSCFSFNASARFDLNAQTPPSSSSEHSFTCCRHLDNAALRCLDAAPPEVNEAVVSLSHYTDCSKR